MGYILVPGRVSTYLKARTQRSLRDEVVKAKQAKEQNKGREKKHTKNI